LIPFSEASGFQPAITIFRRNGALYVFNTAN